METSDADSRHLSEEGVIGTFEASVRSQCPVGRGFLCLWVVVIMWQLEGLIADKQQDYEEGSSALKGTARGKPLICQPWRKLVGADSRRLKKKAFRILKRNVKRILKRGGRKAGSPLFLLGISVICPHFPDAFCLRFSRVISLAWQQVGKGYPAFPVAPKFLCETCLLSTTWQIQNLPKLKLPVIILKQVKALLTPYLHSLSIVYFTSYPSGSSRDVAHKSCVTIKEAIHHAS